MIRRYCCWALLAGVAFAFTGRSCPGQEEVAKLELTAPADWRGEQIALPPPFAPKMTLQGTEVIRFAPGMFDDQAASFFTYVFVLRTRPQPQLTAELIQQELLAYYQGLAEAVAQGRGIDVDPTTFQFELKPREKPEDSRPATQVYLGKLAWVEPFVTGKPQTLHFELTAWQKPAGGHNYLLVLASPKPRDDGVWKTVHEIGDAFLEKNVPAAQ